MRPKPKQRVVTDEAEARSILGIDRTADADAIRSAHRRLIASVHPDRGGSTDLTRRVNAARDLLLKRSAR
nr:DnaJ domain-containing protein [Sphingomonas sp. H160509]